jgi:hypothetical protein
MPITIAHAEADKKLAAQLSKDLSSMEGVGPRQALVVLLSPAGIADADVLAQITRAAEARQHIIPLMVTECREPRIIDHLPPLDFRSGKYPLEAFKAEVTRLTAANAPQTVTTHTPSIQRANRRAAYALAVPVIIVFVAALIMIGVFGLSAPSEEFDIAETERVDMRNTLIAPTLEALLPQDSAQAAGFASTVEAVSTRLRPFLSGTATATAQGTFIPSVTPILTVTVAP